jgi:hypothetical protein
VFYKVLHWFLVGAYMKYLIFYDPEKSLVKHTQKRIKNCQEMLSLFYFLHPIEYKGIEIFWWMVTQQISFINYLNDSHHSTSILSELLHLGFSQR